MNVTLFARGDTRMDPYVLMFTRALEEGGLTVRVAPRFDLKWLRESGGDCDILHLHWVEGAYKPDPIRTRFDLLNRLFNNSMPVVVLRCLLRLTGFTLALRLARARGKYVAHSVHNPRPHDVGAGDPLAAIHRLAQRILVAQADVVHVHSRGVYEQFRRDFPRVRRLELIPLWNYIGWYPNTIPRDEARRQLDLPPDAFVYLFLGLLRPYKGVEELLAAYRRIATPSTRLIIAGRPYDAGYAARLDAMARANPDVVYRPGFVPDDRLQVYMNASDVSVFPYRELATSGAAMLALSFGRPIVGPAIGFFTEILQPDTGVLYDPDQPDGLTNALREAARRAWDERRILESMREYDWARMAPRLVALYDAKGR